jgi:D-alanyl-D-alanine dipeptidase
MAAYDQPIPMHRRAPTAGNYQDIPIHDHDSRFGEALVDARSFGIAGENYYDRTDGQNTPYDEVVPGAVCELWCRQSIAAMLVAVNDRLADYGAELYVWDAYRPITCQQALWDFYWRRFSRETPHADDAALAAHVCHYVSDPRGFDPDDPHTWPAHATGAALDLTLRDRRTGDLLDMGTHFDDMSTASHSDYFERLLHAGRIAADDARLRNRRLLHWAMKAQGFTNYSFECWHFDYGNQMYVMMLAFLGRDHGEAAWYGYVQAPAAT